MEVEDSRENEARAANNDATSHQAHTETNLNANIVMQSQNLSQALQTDFHHRNAQGMPLTRSVSIRNQNLVTSQFSNVPPRDDIPSPNFEGGRRESYYSRNPESEEEEA